MTTMHPRYITRTENAVRLAELRHQRNPTTQSLRRLARLRKRLAAYMEKVNPDALAAYRAEMRKLENNA